MIIIRFPDGRPTRVLVEYPQAEAGSDFPALLAEARRIGWRLTSGEGSDDRTTC